MLLAYFEGVGIITGFAIGYFGRRVSAQINPRLRKRTILGSIGVLFLAFVFGFIWLFVSIPGGNWVVVKDCVMGFLGMATVGWALGLFAEWLARKYFLK